MLPGQNNSRGRRTIRPEDISNFRFVHSPCISSDGKNVLFVDTHAKCENEYTSEIWKYSIDSGQLLPIVNSGTRLFNPIWSPSSDRLVYLANGKTGIELWICSASGNENRKLLSLGDRKVIDLKWARDGDRVYFISDWSADVLKPKRSDVKLITRRMYRFDGEGYTYDRWKHVFFLEIRSSELTQLTHGSFDIVAFDISPDGQEIALAANIDENADFQNNIDIFTMGSKPDAKLHKIYSNTGAVSSVSYSPDQKYLAFVGDDYRFKFNTPEEVWLLNLSSREVSNMSGVMDRPARNSLISDVSMDKSGASLQWRGDEVFFLATDRGRCNVYSASFDKVRISNVTCGEHTITSFHVSSNGTMAYVMMDTSHLPELFIHYSDATKDEKQVTNFNRQLLEEVKLSKPQEYIFKARDGVDIQSFLYEPIERKPHSQEAWPCIVQIHGGAGTVGYSFMHEYHCEAANGYAVLTCNFRGTQGFGADYMRVLTGHYMEKDYSDIIDMVKHALNEGWIDRKRIGVTGGSYGGYLTNWAVTHDEEGLFAAAVTDRSVVNLYSFCGTSDDYRRIEYDVIEAPPWEKPELYLNKSPIGHIQNANMPLLIIHSENDYRCPIEQAEQLYSFLKQRGNEVALVVFPAESHGLSRGGMPHHRVERLLFGLWWFTSHIETGSKVLPPSL